MKVITKNKTTELIRLASGYNGYIVCRGRKEVGKVCRTAKCLGVDINYPLTYEEFLGRRYSRRGVKKIFLDDVEHFIQYISGAPIAAVTISLEEK